jgi:predicted phosphodiesterase
MVVGDTHGDERDTKACKRAIEFAKSFRAEIRIHLGDAFDFRWLRKSASKDEQEGRITDDLDAGIEFLSAYRPTHFLWGNHDQRIIDRSETSVGFMQTLCLHVIERIENALEGVAQVRPYGKRRLLQIDDWRFGHGWGAGINATRDHALRYGNICIGHLHRVERVQAARFDAAVGICAGCLCKLDLDYNRSQLNTLAQSQGFVYGERRNGRWRLQQEFIA